MFYAGLVFLGLLVHIQICGGATVCQITREGSCVGGNVPAGMFNETTTNGTVCLSRASFYQNLCQNSGITTARALASGVSTTVGNYCQITRRGSCPNIPGVANSTFRDFYGERSLNAMTEAGCLQRANDFHITCGSTGSTMAYFGGSGISRRQPVYCMITRQGDCPRFPNLANKTFQAVLEEDMGATAENVCLSISSVYQIRCGNSSFTTARFVPSAKFRRVPQYCFVTIDGNCINHPEYSNSTVQDIAGENLYNATIPEYCLKRAKDFYIWCGNTVISTATYSPTGAVEYEGKYCLITRNGGCTPSSLYADKTFRAPLAEVNATKDDCYRKAIDYQCYCNSGGTTTATFTNSSFTYTSTLCCYPPRTTCGSSCVDLTSDRDNCGACGNACPVGEYCENSNCTFCVNGGTYCGNKCVDVSADETNCGSCGNVCPSGQYCVGGSCSMSCPYNICDIRCVDFLTDPLNCAACSNNCTYERQVCMNAFCVGTGFLRFSATWSAPADVDIFVRVPSGNTIYYQIRTFDGGYLDRDDTGGTGPENVYWDKTASPPPDGSYDVCAGLWDGASVVNVTITVEKKGVLQTFFGTRLYEDSIYYNCSSAHPDYFATITWP